MNMKSNRLVTFSIICVLFVILFYFMQTFQLTRNFIRTSVPNFNKQVVDFMDQNLLSFLFSFSALKWSIVKGMKKGEMNKRTQT